MPHSNLTELSETPSQDTETTMISETIEIFVDTNSFIHLRDLKDLQWRNAFPEANRINIIVASCVIGELDKLKNWNNSRKRDRARLALKLIEEASKLDGLSLVVREFPIEIRIVISNAPPPDWSLLPRLDQSKPDDQLVAEIAAYQNKATLLSYDTGPRIRARLANLAAIEPLEDWHLPPEKTEDQRKITELERNLERALLTAPKISASFDKLDEHTPALELFIPILKPFDASSVAALTAAYLALHPKYELTLRDELSAWHGFGNGNSRHDIERYEKAFDDFKRQTKKYFEHLHDTLARVSHILTIDYSVLNDSGVSANGLRIETSLVGGASLLCSERDIQQAVGSMLPPEPPKKPANMHEQFSQYLGPMQNPHNKPRDPTKFFWFEAPTFGSKNSAHQCEDFRARRSFKDEVILWVTDEVPFSGQLTLHVSATNLPAPVTVTASLSVVRREQNWSNHDVLEMLPGPVKSLIICLV